MSGAIPDLDFKKMNGLVPTVIQDRKTGEVLMLGFVNQDAWMMTLRSGYVTFFSRTKNKLWIKGDTSGNRLLLLEALTDCDTDSLLLKVRVEGPGIVCHKGTRSCFAKRIELAHAITRGGGR